MFKLGQRCHRRHSRRPISPKVISHCCYCSRQ
jgi:hypothetical protein